MRGVQVRPHPRHVYDQPLDQASGLVQQVVGDDGGIGQGYSFGAGMGDVALMPERYSLQYGDDLRAHHAGEPADSF